MENASTKEVIKGFDLTKFVLSFFVVAIHTELFGEYIYPIVRIAVPLYFIISSYIFFENLKGKDSKEKNQILKKYIRRNLLLYLFWFIVLLPITIIEKGYFSMGRLGLVKFLINLTVGSTFYASWYIMAQVEAILLLYLLSEFLKDRYIALIALIFFITCLLTSNYSFLIVQDISNIESSRPSIGTIFPPNSFIIGFVFCFIGKILSRYFHIFKELNAKKTMVLIILSLIFLFIEEYLLRIYHLPRFSNDTYIFLIPLSIFIFILVRNMKLEIRLFKELRNLSSIIYCLHFSMYLLINKMFISLSMFDYMNIFRYVITIVICITVGILMIQLSKKVKLLRYFY